MDTFGESGERNKVGERNNRGGGGELQLGEKELPLADVFSRCRRSIHERKRGKKVEESGFPRELIATEKFGARLFADFPGMLTSRETPGPPPEINESNPRMARAERANCANDRPVDPRQPANCSVKTIAVIYGHFPFLPRCLFFRSLEILFVRSRN